MGIGLRALAGSAMLALVLLAAPAHADIKSYNAAVTRGDLAAAAAEAAGVWPGLDKSRPDIFVIGREFAWTAMQADKPGFARDVLASLSASSAKDDAPEVTAVLAAWAALGVKDEHATRGALAQALKARAARPGNDYVSVRAAKDLFYAQWKANEMQAAADTAANGVVITTQLGASAADVVYTMRRFQTVAAFVNRPDRGDFSSITKLRDELQASLRNATDPKQRDWLISELANTMSWREVERAVLNSRGLRVPDDPKEPTDKDDHADDWFPAPGDPSKPVCDIHVDTAGVIPKYPHIAESHNMPGHVIYAFEVAPNGALKSARILGSAPHESFRSTIDAVLGRWGWKERTAIPGCRMPQQLIVHFVFQIGYR